MIKENNTINNTEPSELQKAKAKRIRLWINAIGLFIFLAVCTAVVIAAWPYMGKFINEPGALEEFLQGKGFWGVIIFLAIQVLQVVVAIIPGEVVEVAAGVVFGWFWGFVLVLLGITIGTFIIFFVFRRTGKPLIEAALGDNRLKKFEKLDKHKNRDRIIFIMFFIIGLPKDIFTYAAAFFDISIWRFFLLTTFARIPAIISSTVAGSSLAKGDIKTTIIIFVITGIISILGYLFSEKIFKLMQRRRAKSNTDKE